MGASPGGCEWCTTGDPGHDCSDRPTSVSDDITMPDCHVDRFRDVLAAATASVAAVEPPSLRSALALWFMATSERARIEAWRSLLGRNVVAVWSAAVAVLAEAERRKTSAPVGE